jgi:hypothetical protein
MMVMMTPIVVKLRTFCGDRLDNFYMFIGAGQTGINGSAHQYQRKARCTVCTHCLVSLSHTHVCLLFQLKGMPSTIDAYITTNNVTQRLTQQAQGKSAVLAYCHSHACHR